MITKQPCRKGYVLVSNAMALDVRVNDEVCNWGCLIGDVKVGPDISPACINYTYKLSVGRLFLPP